MLFVHVIAEDRFGGTLPAMLDFVRTVLLIAFSMSLFGAFGLMVFSSHLLSQWVGGIAGAVVGILLALGNEGYLRGEPDSA